MSTIHAEHRHSLTKEEARTRAEEYIRNIAEKVHADIRWSGDTASFKGTGFSGQAQLRDSLIVLDIDLSFVLRPLKGKIEERMVRAFEKRFS